MYGSDYLWVLPGYHQVDWWRNVKMTNFQTILSTSDNMNSNERAETQQHSCTNEQLNEVLQGHFALEFAPLREYSNQLLVSNRVMFFLKVFKSV